MPVSVLLFFIFVVIAPPTGLRAHEESAVALADLDALIAAAPSEPVLYLRRAAHREEHADWAAAAADLVRATALAPADPTVLAALGRLQMATGDLAAARAQFDRALVLAPADAATLILRARAHTHLGASAAAHADYTTALRLVVAPTPELFLARAALPIAPAAALAGVEEGLARLGPAATLLERASVLALQLGRTDEALRFVDLLGAHTDRREFSLHRRGKILAAAGRTAEARTAFSHAVVSLAAQPEWLRAATDSRRLAADLDHATASLK